MEELDLASEGGSWTGTQIVILVVLVVVTNAVTGSAVFLASSAGPVEPPADHTVMVTGILDLTDAPENSTLTLAVIVDVRGTVELDVSYEVKRCRDGEESLSLNFSSNVSIEAGLDYQVNISANERMFPFDLTASEDVFGFAVSFDPASSDWQVDRSP